MDKISLEVVTPSGRALQSTADEVIAPGARGEFTVLPGHLPLLISLRAGILSFRSGGELHKSAVGDGFAEVSPEKVLIITDNFKDREGIDPVLVRQELAHVQTELQKAEIEPAEKKALIAKESWLAAQLDLYGGEATPAIMRPGEDWDAETDEEPLVQVESN